MHQTKNTSILKFISYTLRWIQSVFTNQINPKGRIGLVVIYASLVPDSGTKIIWLGKPLYIYNIIKNKFVGKKEKIRNLAYLFAYCIINNNDNKQKSEVTST